jgi:hypothetical protein
MKPGLRIVASILIVLTIGGIAPGVRAFAAAGSCASEHATAIGAPTRRSSQALAAGALTARRISLNRVERRAAESLALAARGCAFGRHQTGLPLLPSSLTRQSAAHGPIRGRAPPTTPLS